MKLGELLKGIETTGGVFDPELEVAGLTNDSRKVREGWLFAAVPGTETDGHRFIGGAVENGAAAVLCQRPPELSVPYIQVEDSRKALARLSINFYRDPSSELKVVGVTGTNGKTTTTVLIKQLLEAAGKKVGLIGTIHSMIGSETVETESAAPTTPDAPELQKLLRRMADAGCEYAVMEVSSHALALGRVDGITFETGIFTNLTGDHLDFHGTMEKYRSAKASLFTRCRMGIINLDDASADDIKSAATCPLYTYSAERNEADLVAKSVRLKADKVEFAALTIGSLQKIELGMPGRFSVYNALCVIAFGITQGMELPDIAAALKSARGVKGRVEVAYSSENYTMIIDYAHTPDALENVLTAVKGVAEGRTVALFGCGGDRDKTKRPLMGEIAGRLADFVVVTSDNPRTEAPGDIIGDILEGMQGARAPYIVIEDRVKAIAYAMDNAQKGDVIVLAGKGHEDYQIVGHEKRHMDEREIIAEHLAEKRKT